VRDVVEENKKAKKALGFLMGQIIQKAGGQVNPKLVSQILQQKLNALKGKP
jgi:Asp-tRNA(Asn)/Glu-tRNA(Gln) amidotransferase B subunit